MKRTLVSLLGLVACATAHAGGPAIEQCRQRVIDYAYFWDQADAAGFAEVFTAEATLTLGGETFSGRDAIVQRMTADRGSTMRHLMSTVRITATGDDAASGVSYVTVYAAAPVDQGLPEADAFALLAEYHDRFRITADDCRIVERTLVPVMRQRRR